MMRDVTLEDLSCAAILGFFAVQGAIPFIAPNQALESTRAAASGLIFYGGILSQFIVYGGIAFLLLCHAPRIFRWFGAMQWAAALAVLVIASTIWSQFPLLTMRRSLPFALAGLFGLYLAVRFPVRRQLLILWMAMAALALGTAVMAICFPKLGLDASAGHHLDWQGVFTQKNACGRMMVLATAVVLAEWRISPLKITSLLAFLVVMVMSGSRGAWVIEAVVLALYALLAVARCLESRSRVVLFLAASCLAAVLAGIVWYYLPVLLSMLGRNATLTGRTEIWKQVWRFIMERPALGWGYAAFWRGIEGQSFEVVAAVRFIVFHAHNGFLEIWLELGLPGLVFFALSYLRAWRKLWPVLRSGDINRGMWMVFVLVLIALYDLDENTLLIYNGLFWVLYVAVLANIELLVVEDRFAHGIVRALVQKASGERPGKAGLALQAGACPP
jgi:exopolysaccharide production protein ExoQ